MTSENISYKEYETRETGRARLLAYFSHQRFFKRALQSGNSTIRLKKKLSGRNEQFFFRTENQVKQIMSEVSKVRN